MKGCDHIWSSNAGAGGAPEFRILFSSRVTRARCLFCKCASWLTSTQWRDLKTTRDRIPPVKRVAANDE